MGDIYYNNMIVRNSENLIIFTGTLTGTTTTSTTLATTTTSTTLATTTTTTTLATTTTSTTLATTTSTTLATTTTTTAYVPQVGDFYQGGIIIITNGITGITALQGDISGNIWGWTEYSKTGLSTDGYINTQIMVADPRTAYVALDAWNFTSGIYSDWYLPSLYEMNLMMDVNQNYPLTLDMEGAYWTSNQQNANNAWVCVVYSDKTYKQTPVSKQNSYKFRPVRKF